jgi:hypothetical protein
MKSILGLVLIACSVATSALTCTSVLNGEKKAIEIIEKAGGITLLEVQKEGVQTYLLGSNQGSFYLLEYVAFDHLGVEHTLSISNKVQHCRARVCNSNPFGSKLGVLSSVGLQNEYFDCL